MTPVRLVSRGVEDVESSFEVVCDRGEMGLQAGLGKPKGHCRLWTAPILQGFFVILIFMRSGHLSGLFTRRV